MSAIEWHVGQEVILRERLHHSVRDSPVAISRVGRTYFYIQKPWGEVAFRKDDGIEKGVGGYLSRIFTPESLAEHGRRKEAEKRIVDLMRGWGWMRPLSTDALEQIAGLIEGAD